MHEDAIAPLTPPVLVNILQSYEHFFLACSVPGEDCTAAALRLECPYSATRPGDVSSTVFRSSPPPW